MELHYALHKEEVVKTQYKYKSLFEQKIQVVQSSLQPIYNTCI